MQWNLYFNFCDYFEYACLPAQVNTLVHYVKFLDGKMKSHKTLLNYVARVKKLHVLLGVSTANFDDLEVYFTIKGLGNLSQHTPAPAKPMDPLLLTKIKAQLDLDRPKHKVFWALCITAFFILPRKSNLVADTKFDPTKQLANKHVKITQDEQKLTLHLHWSKTHRPGQGPVKYTLRKIHGSSLCAYSALVDMQNTLPEAGDNDPLFRWPDGSAVKYREFMKMLRSALKGAGVEPAGYSTHSFRSGGATWAFNSGVPGEIIKIVGNWKSDCYLRYILISDQARDVAAQLFGQHFIDCGV